MNETKYKAGQVWNYNTRPQETNSTLIILKVEELGAAGTLVNIGVLDLKIKNPQSEDGFTREIGHMPFYETAIDESVTTLVLKNGELPDYEEGYNQWKESFDDGNAGAFTITVGEAMGVMEQIFN